MKMNKLYKHIIILLILMANNFLLVSQNSSADFKMPPIVPASPEAKGMGKFGDVPVGAYTGTPDISIPIYTVKSGKLSLPITLSYHATGIEVAQEATWVGLGWNLIAGGTISYIPVGEDDRSGTTISPYDFRNLIKFLGSASAPSVGNEDGCVGFNCTSPISDAIWVKTAMLPALLSGRQQQDVYSANFANYSFKFIKNPIYGLSDNNLYPFLPADEYVFMGQKNKCKIEAFAMTYSYNGLPVIDNGFIFKGEDGTIFRFEGVETSSTSKALSWVLTQITSPVGDVITLKYKKVQMTNLPALSEQYMLKNGSGIANRTLSENIQRFVPYLETIETNNELIVFESDNTRNDIIYGGCRLNKITIKDKINQTDKFSYRFSYDYFTGVNVGGDYLSEDDFYKSNPTYNESVKKNRLKLNSVIESSNNSDNDQYVFSYYGSALPYKTSFAMDHWGYYNGQENGSQIILNKYHTIIPNALPLVLGNPLNYGGIDNRFYSLHGAIRGASKDSTIYTAGMLKSIQYPTKGKTVFTYEPHDFSNYNYVSAEDEKNINSPTASLPQTATVQAFGTTPYPATAVTQTTFTLTARSSVTLTGYTDYTDGSITISGQNYSISRQGINQTNTNGHIAEWSEYLWLEAGTYTLTCTTPPSNISSSDMKPEIWAQVTYNYDNQASLGNIASRCSTCSYIGGGLRVKGVVNYDENNNVVSSKKYSYISENGSSSGQLLIPLQNLNKKDIIHRQCPINHSTDTWVIPTCTLYGSSYVSLSGYLTGNNVGYNRVEVQSYSSNSTNGKEISYYDNTPGLLYFGKIPFFPSQYNGNLLKTVITKANGDTLLTEKSNYGLLFGTNYSYTLNILTEDTYEGPDICNENGTIVCAAYPNRLKMYSYPTQNFYNALFSKETTHYFSTGKVKETVDYTYNTNNYCLSSSKTDASDGLKYVDITYPVDYPTDPVLSAMVLRNQLNLPVVKSEYKNSSNQQKTIIDYILWQNSFYAPSKISLKIGANPVDERVVFDNYDVYGNVTEAHLSDGIKGSYYYAYNNSLPIVKGVNISSQTLNSVVQQALTTTGYSTIDNLLKSISSLPSSAWTTFNTTIRNNSSGSLITTYTYDPVFGMTSMTDPRGVTTNYSYDAFSRLSQTSNDDKSILSRYLYGYKNASGNGPGAYTAPVATVTPGATTYNYGTTGTATLSSVSGGSGSYIYNWYLKNSSGTVLASNLNTTSASFSFTCSQGGPLTIQCVITDNITGLSSTPSTTITSGAVTVNGSFSTTSGYSYPFTSLSKTGSSVTFVLVFLPTSSPMSVGYDYYIASVSAGFQPSASRTISYNTGGRTWNITFNSNGSVYCRIVSGTNLPVGNTVAFGSLTYNL